MKAGSRSVSPARAKVQRMVRGGTAALLSGLSLFLSGAVGAGDFMALAPGVHRYDGAELSASAAGGEAGNVGLLVGRDAALLIDSGASHRQGREVLAALRRVTARPVRLALISHAGPEFLFGASALQDAGIAVYARRATGELIARRCVSCLESARQNQGEDAMAGSRVPVPDRLGEGELRVELGGRRATVLDLGWVSRPGELVVFDPASGTLFAGGAVLVGRVPAIRDADLALWIAALDRLSALPIGRVVPGHGPVAGPEALGSLRAYLVDLAADVRRQYAAGLSLAAATAAASLPAYAGWTGYPEIHRQNVHHLYLALEREELAGVLTSLTSLRPASSGCPAPPCTPR